jgi:co-chaperonin GroES (HSP10)
VQPLEANEATSAGIVLPDEVRDKEQRGMVIEVGEVWKDYDSTGEIEMGAIPLEPGQTIIWEKGHGIHVQIDDGEGHITPYVILDFREVLVVLEDVPSGVVG